ncbi:type IV-A pilus assembly ATPase PilB [Desulfurivibrio dismutans]|uniref:type IV-A pilus assembly ATPase PilB n=1 Tax=Desulfurivibrio dismutans TaxID=1398908 RepID=UPI0023DCC607|nr:type IV-A pilus assembly ATPase PilB [Desulfurivibrio alkaliphilus]MDF1615046.1 type IV-A pilus assembly ATPase PilB [Desulfurivibrio alkaliphilus]
MVQKPQKSTLRASVKDQSGAGKVKIGELLRKEGQISSNQLNEALAIQKKKGGRLSSILLKLGYIDENTVVNFLSRQHNYQPVTLAREAPKAEALAKMPYEIASKYLVLPLRVIGKNLQITMAEPTDTQAVENLQGEVGMPLTVGVSTEREIIESYRTHYKISDEEYQKLLQNENDRQLEDEAPVTQIDDFGALASEAAEGLELESFDEEEISGEYSASDAPIIKLVNGILVKAVQDGVSDIHIEPYEKNLQVRYRLDGALYKSMNLPLSIKNALNSRIKIMSQLDITERRVPQDGRIRIKMGRNRAIDFRVSTLPTLFGESVVMRILDKSSLNVDLTQLGFERKTFEMLKRCISQPQGLLLVTGPTGSGKTVTLYSILNSLNSEDIKILTAEDPVEFNFKGINQVNVINEVGMTFAAALKAFLRQDPDIVMVGEIRDMETAEIAIKAAMTGHLVLSTLHTNDCPATIGRLMNIGIPSYMLASAVTMVLSQRLARRLCPKCKAPVDVSSLDQDELVKMGFDEEEISDLKIFGPVGCPACNGRGYKGRVGLFELMEVTDEVAKAINAEVPEDQLRKIAVQEGMTPLRDAGLQKVREGMTSIDEVLRRTVITEESLPAYLVHPDIEEYQDGDIIIRQDNTDRDFFKLVNGALNVIRDGKKIAEITEPGEYFGEMSAISGEPRSATILAQGRCKIKRFPGDKLLEVIEKYPEVGKHLFKTLVSRLNQANGIIVKLANDRAARVAKS